MTTKEFTDHENERCQFHRMNSTLLHSTMRDINSSNKFDGTWST